MSMLRYALLSLGAAVVAACDSFASDTHAVDEDAAVPQPQPSASTSASGAVPDASSSRDSGEPSCRPSPDLKTLCEGSQFCDDFSRDAVITADAGWDAVGDQDSDRIFIQSDACGKRLFVDSGDGGSVTRMITRKLETNGSDHTFQLEFDLSVTRAAGFGGDASTDLLASSLTPYQQSGNHYAITVFQDRVAFTTLLNSKFVRNVTMPLSATGPSHVLLRSQGNNVTLVVDGKTVIDNQSYSELAFGANTINLTFGVSSTSGASRVTATFDNLRATGK